VIDPSSQLDDTLDVLVIGDKIARIGKKIMKRSAQQVDARGKIVCPGLIDLHCHLRDPGRPDNETIETGSQSAVAGGFTTVCCMPNTEPPIDNEGIVNYIYKQAARVDLCRVYPIAAITKQRAGREITEFGELIKAGVKAFSDDGDVVADSGVFRRALEYSKTFNVPLFEHPIDPLLAQEGVMNEGVVSTRLGLKGSPGIAEEVIVARDIALAKFTGARLHLCHISTKNAIELIRAVKKQGINITCETCPHYFYFTDENVETFDTNFKVNPPLRSEEDRVAVIEALRDGTIDCIATDHAPHCQADKELEFNFAPFGMIGFETALSMVLMELVEKQKFSLAHVLAKMTVNPASVIGEKTGVLKKGSPADITIIDVGKKWKVTASILRSRSKNTPLLQRELVGKCSSVVVNGEMKYQLAE
jgi:dihydroorotase